MKDTFFEQIKRLDQLYSKARKTKSEIKLKRCLEIPLSLLRQAPRTTREQIGSLGQEMLKQGDILLNLIFNEGLDGVDYKLTNNQTFN